jgi:Heavy metal associated domain 2
MESENGARIVHRSSGRLRVRVDRVRSDADLVHRIVERLSSVPGVTRIETRADTGSVLVLFEPSVFDEERLAGAAREAELFHLSAERTETIERRGALPPGAIARAVWERANSAVNQRSQGPLDLRTLFPLALAVWAVRQILTERPLARTPWYTLLWYAWGLYSRFNAAPREPRRSEPVSADL